MRAQIMCLSLFYFITYILADMRQRYGDYAQKYGKNYNQQEYEDHLETYTSNMLYIKDRNENGNLSYQLGEGPFTDITLADFKNKYLGHIKRNNPNEGSLLMLQSPSTTTAVVTPIDWSSVVSPVKDQGTCGSCWAFASIASVEANFKLKYNSTILLSEEEIIDCTTGPAYGMLACNGGIGFFSLKYMKEKGISRAEQYPYVSGKATARYKTPKCTNSAVKPVIIDTIKTCSDPNEYLSNCTFTDWINQLAQGPMDVAIAVWDNATVIDFQHYKNGTFVGNCPEDFELNHEILAVAYDPVTKTGKFKNQWGTGWGDKGFINISIGESQSFGYSCGVTRNGYVPSVSVNKNCVILYDLAKYDIQSNKSIVLCKGDPLANLANLANNANKALYGDTGGFSKIISAIKLAPGAILTVFTEPNFGGNSLIINSNVEDLETTTFNNAIQSILFGAVNPTDLCIKIYDNIDITKPTAKSLTVCYKDTSLTPVNKFVGFYKIPSTFDNKAVRVVLQSNIASVAFYDTAAPASSAKSLQTFTSSGNFSTSNKSKASSLVLTLKMIP